MAQNFNDLLNYIKVQLGVPINHLELTDDDIVDYIKNHVIPEFSQYEPATTWVLVTEQDRIDPSNNYNENTYKMNIPDDINMIDVNDVYFSDQAGMIEGSMSMYLSDPRDIVMSNAYISMMESLRSVQTFHYTPPDIIRFSKPIDQDSSNEDQGVIAELNIEHMSPSTIPSDSYQKIFKKMSLYNVIYMVLALRSKYENLSTPFGEINLNVDKLQNRAEKLEEEVNEMLRKMPPRYLIEFPN